MAKIRNNPFKPILKMIPAPIRNRYFLVLAFFFGWMIFFDSHDILLTQYRLQQSVNKLKADKTFYEEKIKEVRQEALDIELNREKFAREKYYMKKKNEDVFIMVREGEASKDK